jgi:hypothetical protein
MITSKSLWIYSLVLLLSLACSKTNAPISPTTGDLSASAVKQSTGGKILWGMWDITIDPITSQAEIVPIRGAEFTCNVTMFMQAPIAKVNLLGININAAQSDLANGLVVCDVSLRHPFPSLAFYRGFDVHGICMGDGSAALSHDSTATCAGPGDLVVLNADGYTRWWNTSEFAPKETIFSYQAGKLAPKNYTPTAMLNGYKVFADELLPGDILALDPTQRGTFSPSSVNTRTYKIQFPVVAGIPVYKFAYAVEANWDAPDESGAPSYPMDSFPGSANVNEPYMVTLADAGSTAWYIDDANKGGSFKLNVEVFDWQAPVNPLGVKGELSGLWIEGESITSPVDVLSSATVSPGGPTSSIFQFELTDLNLTHSGPQDIWIIAESASPDTYEPQFGGDTSSWSWPNAKLASYLRTSIDVSGIEPQNAPIVTAIVPNTGNVGSTVPVSVTGSNFENGAQVELRQSGSPTPYIVAADSESFVDSTKIDCSLNLSGAPLGLYDVVVINPDFMEGSLDEGFEVTAANIIYVDDSNTSGIEDGSQTNPYNTIQEGLTAATTGWEVWVDDSGVNYAGPITLKSGVILKSVNWNASDGDDSATISFASASPVVTGAEGATIDGFEIKDGQRIGIDINAVSTTVKNCIVSTMDDGSYYTYLYGVQVTNSPATVIDNCEVKGMHLSGSYCSFFGIYLNNSPAILMDTSVHDLGKSGNYSSMAGIYATGCSPQAGNKLEITHCSVYDIYPEGSLGGSYTSTFGILIENTNEAELYNNIVRSVTGGNYDNVYGVAINGSTDCEFVNNVIYNVSKAYYYGTAFGMSFTACTNLDVRNTIISHIHKGSNGYFVTAYGATQSASTYLFEYNDVYDCASGNYSGVTPGASCISADPKFVSLVAGSEDFHLASGSPCINTGDPSIQDPDSSQSDMGAYGGPGGSW